MDADFIKKALFKKHNEGWSTFAEFRTATGYTNHVRYIDFLAFPLWSKQKREGVIGYEIKVSRQDFIRDVKNFLHKQQDALDMCENLYYIVPSKLVDPGEVPEGTGLCWVNKAGGIVVKKVAPRRKLTYDIDQIAALMSAGIAKVEPIRMPIKWLGEEITQDQFNEMVESKAQKRFNELSEWQIKNKVDLKVMEKMAEIRDRSEENDKAIRILNLMFGQDAVNHLQEIDIWSDRSRAFRDFVKGDLMKDVIDRLDKIIMALKVLL